MVSTRFSKCGVAAWFGLGLTLSAGMAEAQKPVQPAAVLLALNAPPVEAGALGKSVAAVSDTAAEMPPMSTPPEAVPAVPTAMPSAHAVTSVQSIDVVAQGNMQAHKSDEGISLEATAETVAQTAGAYSDIPRFLQTMPGVAFDSDARNGYLVNGGNVMENRYVLNGVEIPNINHISTAGSSGGFVSVIDTDAISTITLHKQLYGSEYSGTLSSVLDLNTREATDDKRHGELTVGYAGAGFMLEQPIGKLGTTMTQYRRSVVNYMTKDIGFGGVPDYSSLLSTSTFVLNDRDTVKTLFLDSNDKLSLTPNAVDWADPGLVNTVYTGKRSTGAVTWHHAVNDGGNDLQFNYSTVTSGTSQTDDRNNTGLVYSDNLNETPITVRYDTYRERKRYRVQFGAIATQHRIDYKIDQAQGYPSPYTADPTPVDASNVTVSRNPMDDAIYGETTVRVVGNLEMQAGLRYERWGINNSSALMQRLGAKLPLGAHAFVYGGVGSYSQMAPLPVMLGVASNIALKPISNLQTQIGAVYADAAGDRLSTSLYTRKYSSYPVSTQFASLSLADMGDNFGQPSLYMPMVSAGKGTVDGFEIALESSTKRRLFGQVNFTSQSVMHAALDGIYRRANYDMPVSWNVLGGFHFTRKQLVTFRYSAHTGTPYTPFDLTQSMAQGREIFDLTQINTQRGGSYARMDLRYEYNMSIGHQNLKIFVGAMNALNKSNFYQYVLLPADMSFGPYALTQMARYPDGGLVWSF